MKYWPILSSTHLFYIEIQGNSQWVVISVECPYPPQTTFSTTCENFLNYESFCNISDFNGECLFLLTDDDGVGVTCASDEWQCDSGGCIPEGKLCDFVQHCRDGSDEKPAYCGRFTAL